MEAVAAIRRIGRPVEPPTRCKRGSGQPAKKRTRGVNRDGFLTHPFKPFWAFSGNRERAEREFLCSLSHLCKHYNLSIPECVNGSFPQYICNTLQEITQALNSKDGKLQCIIAEDDNHTATLATVRQFNTGMTLYYIPVRPLWYWVQSSQGQRLAELILGMFAYLEQVVKIPFYTEPGSYLGSQYDTIEQWVNDEQEDEKYREMQMEELYTMQNAGLKLYAQISNPHRLEQFENTVLNFHHRESWELDWELIAIEFLALYRQYPNRSVFDHIHSDLLYPDEEDRISADQYISFYWSGEDCFTDTLFDMIDCHFQEIAYMDEPMHVQLFDGQPENATPDFDFETRLFGLIGKLGKLLNDYDYEEREPAIQ
ncbi:MAG: hypothetical protein JWQ66_1674 [Mucilaginibacter sp.]|nr:hypothetical protein [Mucilaginibacter sp.]